MYAAQWIALLSFLSNAFILAPLDSSNRTIWKKKNMHTLHRGTLIKQYICSVKKKKKLNLYTFKIFISQLYLKLLMNSEPWFQQTHTYANASSLTSRWPLKAAWCRAVRPARSDTLTLLSSGTNASAQRTALLAAATCRGVCQFLSRAFTSAECFNKTCTASCKTQGYMKRQINILKHYFSFCLILSSNN